MPRRLDYTVCRMDKHRSGRYTLSPRRTVRESAQQDAVMILRTRKLTHFDSVFCCCWRLRPVQQQLLFCQRHISDQGWTGVASSLLVFAPSLSCYLVLSSLVSLSFPCFVAICFAFCLIFFVCLCFALLCLLPHLVSIFCLSFVFSCLYLDFYVTCLVFCLVFSLWPLFYRSKCTVCRAQRRSFSVQVHFCCFNGGKKAGWF